MCLSYLNTISNTKENNLVHFYNDNRRLSRFHLRTDRFEHINVPLQKHFSGAHQRGKAAGTILVKSVVATLLL
jgi:hypothetical protein